MTKNSLGLIGSLYAAASATVGALAGSTTSPKVRSKPVALSKRDDPAFKAHLKNHPGRSPRYNSEGRRYFNRSRWVPHHGKKEEARHGSLAS